MNEHPYRLRRVPLIIEAHNFPTAEAEAAAVKRFKRYLSKQITTTAAAKVVALGWLDCVVFRAALRAVTNAATCPKSVMAWVSLKYPEEGDQ